MVTGLILVVVFLKLSLYSMTGQDVMARVQEESRKKRTRKATVDMVVFDKDGRERARQFTYWVKLDATGDSSLVTFSLPKSIKGTSLLTIKESQAVAPVQWVYFPAFKSVQRLKDSDKRKGFMGSDFTYSDIAGRKLTQDTHELVNETDDHYFIESIPQNSASAAYSKIRYVISKATHLVLKAVFYDLKNQKLKTLVNNSVSTINDVHVVMNSEMINHITGGKTTLTVQSMDVGLDMPVDVFTIKGIQSQ